MTVKELRDYLAQFADKTPVYIASDYETPFYDYDVLDLSHLEESVPGEAVRIDA